MTKLIVVVVAVVALAIGSMGCGPSPVSEAKCRVFWTAQFASQAPSGGRTAAVEYMVAQCVADHSSSNPAR